MCQGTFFVPILGNANEWGEIESFARKKEKWLRKYLELPYGIPTDDTFRIVIGNINTDHFFEMTVQLLMQSVNDIIYLSGKETDLHGKNLLSVDGKESRGSKRKSGNNGEAKALQTLNVYSSDYGMCLAQKFIEEKTNEIPAAQELLKLMDLKGTIVTADALNCQKDTVSAIVGSKGDYVLALKGNQPLFYEEVQGFFDEEKREKIRESGNGYKKTVEKEHGGVAQREYYITEDVGWYTDRKQWKKLKAFGMVHKTLRKGAKNLQIMKKIVLSILRLVKESYKLSMKRIRYELSLDYENGVERMLSMLDIESIKHALESKGKSTEK